MRYFVLVYDQKRGEVLSTDVFDDDAVSHALQRRLEREIEYPGAEVVVLSGESLETIQRTHARYFMTTGELLAQ